MNRIGLQKKKIPLVTLRLYNVTQCTCIYEKFKCKKIYKIKK